MGNKVSVSPYSMGMVGLHLTINPHKVSTEAKLARPFLDRGLTLNSDDLQTLLDDRSAGIAAISDILGHHLPGMGNGMPGLGPDARLKYATILADLILDKNLSGQLSREAPTTLDSLQLRDDQLMNILRKELPPGDKRGEVPSLLEQTPVGASVTFYF